MHSPERSGDTIGRFVSADAHEVFDAERLLLVSGNEANSLSTQELVDVVRTLCFDRYQMNSGGTYVYALGPLGNPYRSLHLEFNPDGATAGKRGDAPKGLVSVNDCTEKVRLPRPAGMPKFSRTFYHENLYVGQDGIAKVEGIVTTYKGETWVANYASKIATEAEVQGGLTALTEAVFSLLNSKLVAE